MQPHLVILFALTVLGSATISFADHQAAPVIEQALSGAPPVIEQALSGAPPVELAKGKGGSALDQKGELLQEGDGGWKRLPPPAHLRGIPPRCIDGLWMEWADAYLHRKNYTGATFGICYVLAGDDGASNIDRYAEGWSG